jgi:hypothetical protein
LTAFFTFHQPRGETCGSAVLHAFFCSGFFGHQIPSNRFNGSTSTRPENVRLNKVVYGRAMGNTWPADVAMPVMSSALAIASVLVRFLEVESAGRGVRVEVTEKETVAG